MLFYIAHVTMTILMGQWKTSQMNLKNLKNISQILTSFLFLDIHGNAETFRKSLLPIFNMLFYLGWIEILISWTHIFLSHYCSSLYRVDDIKFLNLYGTYLLIPRIALELGPLLNMIENSWVKTIFFVTLTSLLIADGNIYAENFLGVYLDLDSGFYTTFNSLITFIAIITACFNIFSILSFCIFIYSIIIFFPIKPGEPIIKLVQRLLLCLGAFYVGFFLNFATSTYFHLNSGNGIFPNFNIDNMYKNILYRNRMLPLCGHYAKYLRLDGQAIIVGFRVNGTLKFNIYGVNTLQFQHNKKQICKLVLKAGAN